MLIYNVTVNIENDVREEWLHWMTDVHIPDVMNTGCFDQYKILRLLTEEAENTGTTYAIQYRCPDQLSLSLYIEKYAPALQADHKARYANKFVAFRSILEEVASS